METEVLVELSREEIVQLKEMYRNVDGLFYVNTFLEVILNWAERSGKDEFMVTSPNESWKKDGSFVFFLKDSVFVEMLACSLDKSLENVSEGLLKTRRIVQGKGLRFLCVHDFHIDAILDVIKKLGREIQKNYVNNFYKMSIEKALSLEIELPSASLRLEKVDGTAARQINNLWPHKFEGSEELVRKMIEFNGCYGLVDEKAGLVSWSMQGLLGHISLLQTEENFKRKGFAEIIVKVLAKKIAECGHVPVATVIVDNVESSGLFRKIGFEIFDKCYFIIVK